MSSPAIVNNAGAHITFAPKWRYFLEVYLLLLTYSLAFSAIHLLCPYWARLRARVRLASGALGGG